MATECATCAGDGLVAVEDMETGRDAAPCPDCFEGYDPPADLDDDPRLWTTP